MTVFLFFSEKITKEFIRELSTISYLFINFKYLFHIKLLISWTKDLEIKVNMNVYLFYRILLFLVWNEFNDMIKILHVKLKEYFGIKMHSN